MKLAIFDVDGTLTRTTRVDWLCFARALTEEFGITDFPTDFANHTDEGITREIIELSFGRPASEREVARMRERFLSLIRQACASDPRLFEPVPGASGTVRRLSGESGWRVAIATGGWRRSALFKLGRIGLELDRLPAAFAEDGIERRRIVLSAVVRAQQLNRRDEIEKVVCVGDAVWDLRTARELRMGFVGIARGRHRAELTGEGASFVMEDLSDFARTMQFLEAAPVPTVPGRP